MLLGEEGKRKLRLRGMTNDQLFEAYDALLDAIRTKATHKGTAARDMLDVMFSRHTAGSLGY